MQLDGERARVAQHRRLGIGHLQCRNTDILFAKRAVARSTVSEVVVTASRADLLGAASTASQGSVTKKEIDLRPI